MSFKTIEAAIAFYEMYASLSGFTPRLGTTKRYTGGKISLKHIYCNRQGRYSGGSFDSLSAEAEEKQKKNRASFQSGCPARMQVHFISTEGYVVFVFEEKHNHCFAEPEGYQFLESNRKLNISHKTFLGQLANMNIGPTKAHKIFAQLVGGFGNVHATATDFKNWRRDYINFIGSDDADMVVHLNQEKVKNDSGYSFEYFKDDEGRLTRLFWADHTAKINYAVFGDVVSFDATYRTNK